MRFNEKYWHEVEWRKDTQRRMRIHHRQRCRRGEHREWGQKPYTQLRTSLM